MKLCRFEANGRICHGVVEGYHDSLLADLDSSPVSHGKRTDAALHRKQSRESYSST